MDVGILLFDGVDLLDAGGPYEVFLTANRLAVRDGHQAPFNVRTFTVDGQPVTAYGGLGLTPSAPLSAETQYDVVIVPGTIDIETAMANHRLQAAIRSSLQTSQVTASVCTGAFLLAQAGALEGKAWTTHWEDIGALAQIVGESGAQKDVRWVDSGTVVTSGGLACGIDMALHLVSRLVEPSLAQRTAQQIDYPWAAKQTESAGQAQ